MPRRVKEEAEKTRRRILASALSLFVKKGYEKTTFTDIAARLKMTKGAVYWHFESKQVLLLALIDDMTERFHSDLGFKGIDWSNFTFEDYSALMRGSAKKILSDATSRAFFMLMKTQIRWNEASMHDLREALISGSEYGPVKKMISILENGKKTGLVRADVDAVETASIIMAIWDGLLQATIEGFFHGDLDSALKQGFEAVWNDVKKR